MQNQVSRHLTILAVLMGFATASFGQQVSGSIVGSVTDPTHASIPAANVDVVNTATGVHYRTKSNGSGYYTASPLIAGTYTVMVSAQGFETVVQNAISVDVGSSVEVDFSLPVGSLAQSVTVTSAAPLLQTQSAEVATTLTADTLSQLPSKGLNPEALVAVAPGVQLNPGQQGVPGAGAFGGSANYSYEANGSYGQINQAYLDGVEDIEGIGGGSALIPNTDELQEFRVVTSNYDVELGNVAGAVILMTTKSGTNQFHGSAREFNRTNSFYAANPFTGAAGHVVYNLFGAQLGGPVIKNKLFAFGYYDGFRYRSGAPILTTVPTAAFRAGDFSSVAAADPIFDPSTGNPDGTGRTQFSYNGVPNVIPPQRLDPIVQKILADMPLPNNGTGTDNNYTAPAPTPLNADLGSVRTDWAINDKPRLRPVYASRS